jgi:endonuclease YncB( thermonuclease family)
VVTSSSSAQDVPNSAHQSIHQSIYCKILASKEQYFSCHIRVTDFSERLVAIAIGDRYYSFFRRIYESKQVIDMVMRLGHRGDEIAITQVKEGYIVWVYEPDAVSAPPKGSRVRVIPPWFGSASCLFLTDATSYKSCYLQVPDLPKQVPGIQYQGKLYSLLRRESEADQTLSVAAELTRRGADVAIALVKNGYAICVLEPTAI